MLSIANEVDSLIFCCVCFVCDTNMYFSNRLVTLQGAPKAERPYFQYKCPQSPHFATKKKKFWAVFLGRFSLSPFSNFSPKHHQTP